MAKMNYWVFALAMGVSLYANSVKEVSVLSPELSKNNLASLTPLEKEVVNQKESIDQLKRDLQDATVINSELKNSLEGLRSLYESTAQKNSELIKRVEDLEKRPLTIVDGNHSNNSNEALNKISAKMDENLHLQNENFEKVGKSINDLSTVVDEIRQTYVSKDDLNTTLAELKEKSVVKTEQAPSETPVGKEKKSPKETQFSQGVALFEKGQLIKAQKIFETLKSENHNLEGSYFYLGEIAFASRDYRSANTMYQKSLDINANSAYVPKILLHAGTVSQRSGDHAGAKKVFDTLLEVYPSSPEAAEARKLIKK
jgi:TolA-binding protein